MRRIGRFAGMFESDPDANGLVARALRASNVFGSMPGAQG